MLSVSRAGTPEWPTLASHITGSFAGCSPNDVLHPLLQDENPCHWQASCCRRLESELLKSVTEDRSLFHTHRTVAKTSHTPEYTCDYVIWREHESDLSKNRQNTCEKAPVSRLVWSHSALQKDAKSLYPETHQQKHSTVAGA